MEEVAKIDVLQMVLGYSILLIPILIFWYFKIKLTKTTIIAVARMSIQLLLVALYLEYIFELNNPYINLLWIIIMIGVGVITTIKRANLKLKYFVLPLSLALLSSLVLIDSFFLGVVIQLEYIFDARYFIPISGMILGNTMNYNIIGLNTYFEGLIKDENLYHFLLINTNDKKTALQPFIQNAIKKALNPLIATMMVMGLIALPGMMTGQILGGSPPSTAIMYQILIAIAIFGGGTLNLTLSIIFSNRFVFDQFDRLNRDILRK